MTIPQPSLLVTSWKNKQKTMKKDYPWIVVPYDKNEAKKRGLSATFCRDRRTAEECCYRMNQHSGIAWYVKETEDEVLDWSSLNEQKNK